MGMPNSRMKTTQPQATMAAVRQGSAPAANATGEAGDRDRATQRRAETQRPHQKAEEKQRYSQEHDAAPRDRTAAGLVRSIRRSRQPPAMTTTPSTIKSPDRTRGK